jgi:predicted TIM-barrel fold metal-dependent hydrolase
LERDFAEGRRFYKDSGRPRNEGMPIDMHSHYYGGLVDALRRRKARPFVSSDAEGRPVLNAMTASTVMSSGYTDIPARLAYLDSVGLARQVMTFPGALGVDAMPIAEVGATIRQFNDRLAEICRGSGRRLYGLAGLPLDDIAASAAEMRRVRVELGLLGVILPGNFFLSTARAETLRPVFAAANETGALILVHPGVAPGDEVPTPYPDNPVYRMSGLALQASVSQMGITLMYGDLLDAYPNVTVHLVNLGGTLPFILERLEGIAASRNIPGAKPRERLRRLYFDCASLGPRALEMAVKVIGADRIMLGTDYPIFKPNLLADVVAKAEISDAERRMVASGTAESIIDRLA